MIDSLVMSDICFRDSTKKWKCNIFPTKGSLLFCKRNNHWCDSSFPGEFFYTCIKINMMHSMQRINQSIIESHLLHSLGLSRSRSAQNTFSPWYFDRDSIEVYNPTLPSDHILWSRGDAPLLSRFDQKKALHTFEIYWKHGWLQANKIAVSLLKNCLTEWNQRLVLESLWVEWSLDKEKKIFSSSRTQIAADIVYRQSCAHLCFFYGASQCIIPKEWFVPDNTTSLFSRISTFFQR